MFTFKRKKKLSRNRSKAIFSRRIVIRYIKQDLIESKTKKSSIKLIPFLGVNVNISFFISFKLSQYIDGVNVSSLFLEKKLCNKNVYEYSIKKEIQFVEVIVILCNCFPKKIHQAIFDVVSMNACEMSFVSLNQTTLTSKFQNILPSNYFYFE